MLEITSNLSKSLKEGLKKANEVWVAVGLLNNSGLEFILQTVPKTCKLNFIVGIDLPTDPKALAKLLLLKGKRAITVKILTEDFFHPKVYLIKSDGQLTAFVGSANCTNGGLETNIEMSLSTKDNSVCKNLINWFEKVLLPASQLLTVEFINDYRPKYDNRMKRQKKEKDEISELKKEEKLKHQANIKAKAKFISELKRFRRTRSYLQDKHDRQLVIRELKRCLDYPNFKKLDLKTFFSIKELGTIVAIRVKGKILANPSKFTKLMKMLCDENLPLKTRIDEALNGNLSIENVGEGFISKVLITHNPNRYYVHNKAFTDKLRPFGLVLPRGLSFGEKYELTRDILKQIITETNINNFATLDQCLWMI